jgi:hypothetical protein
MLLVPCCRSRYPFPVRYVCQCLQFYNIFPGEKLPAGFPRVAQSPGTKVVEVGHATVLQCDAHGSPPPRVHWVRDMLPVDVNNPRYTVLEAGKSEHIGNTQNRPLLFDLRIWRCCYLIK